MRRSSSSPPSLIDAVLTASGLLEKFEATLSTEQVEAGKPSPAVYLALVEHLGVQPDRAVAIEDSSNGMRSAAAAGLSVIAVPNQDFPPEPDALALAARRVDRIGEVTPELIRSLP